jgi:hypothetical protein
MIAETSTSGNGLSVGASHRIFRDAQPSTFLREVKLWVIPDL